MLGSLPPDQRARYAELVDAIRQNNRAEIVLRIECGHYLIQVKELLNHGEWLTWFLENAETGYASARTAQRDMALARELYHRMDEITSDTISITALFELCRPQAQEQALDTSLALASEGVRITRPVAAQLNTIYEVDLSLGERVRDGVVSISHAAALAEYAQSSGSDEQVAALAIEHTVDPALIEPLAQLRAQCPDEFESVVASGGVFNALTETQVGLSQASPADVVAAINIQEAEKMARHQEHLRNWKKERPARLADITGTPKEIITQLQELMAQDAQEQYRVYVYGA
jgi:hypothetical protein